MGSGSVVFASELLRFRLVLRLVPLGSTWFHEALDVLFAALCLGSCWVPLGSASERLGFCSTRARFHKALDVLFAALWLGFCLVAITTEMGGQWIAGTTVQCSC